MNTTDLNPTNPLESTPPASGAEPMSAGGFIQCVVVLGGLGVVAYKLLDAALRLL